MNSLVNIKHHGAVNGVTGSCHELILDNKNSVLIDCGLFQGAETSSDGAAAEKLEIEFPIENIRALLVTHCHIDHVGRIPYLLAAGFNGPIVCSKPTAMLLPLVLEDAIKIGFTRNTQLINRVLKKIKSQIIGVDYGKWKDLSHLLTTENLLLKTKYKPAGHILGSAYIECQVQKANENKNEKLNEKSKEKIIFSGDLGAPYTPLLPSPKSPYSCDRLIIESTYGDRLHGPRKNRTERLKSVIEHCLENNGVVLVPAFSVGRTQELLYELEHIIHQHNHKKEKGSNKGQGKASVNWDSIEIIVDSPMASEFTKYYRELSKYWDKEAKKRLKAKRHPLAFSQLTTIDSHEEHQMTLEYLATRKKPAIVIAASGMISGGRILNYVKRLIDDERTDILFVGYQANGTPGRDIQKYAPNVSGKGGYVIIDGKKYNIKAQVHTITGYSAHADQKDLINFVTRMRKKPKEIRIIHGDEEAKAALQKILKTACPKTDVIIP
ncbi:MAG: MBL fold metallo-hydrolase [Gammaproteobacteria bacterium]|nr:MBL fold metallo-hydrolase [Gammaproteobacteria bacterium]